MDENPIDEASIPVLGLRIWARNRGLINTHVPFVPAEIRDANGDEVLLLVRGIRNFKRWVPRSHVFLRWDSAYDAYYQPERVPDLLSLPILNPATISLHILNRDFTWLRLNKILIGKGPFAIRDGDEIDFEAEAGLYRQDKRPVSSMMPHPFALCQKGMLQIWKALNFYRHVQYQAGYPVPVRLGNSPRYVEKKRADGKSLPGGPKKRNVSIDDDSEDGEDEIAQSTKRVARDRFMKSVCNQAIVLEGSAKSGKTAWSHFLTRFLVTGKSYEQEDMDLPILSFLGLFQSLTQMAGMTHDYESQVGILATFQFYYQPDDSEALLKEIRDDRSPVNAEKSGLDKADACSLQLVGTFSPAHFHESRSSFAIFRTMAELQGNPLRLPIEQKPAWYRRRQGAFAEVFDMRSGLLYALEQLRLDSRTVESKARVTPAIILEKLSAVEHLKSIKVQYADANETDSKEDHTGIPRAYCRLSPEIYDVADKLGVSAKHLGRSLCFKARLTRDLIKQGYSSSKLGDLLLTVPISTIDEVKQNCQILALHLYERIVEFLLKRANKILANRERLEKLGCISPPQDVSEKVVYESVWRNNTHFGQLLVYDSPSMIDPLEGGIDSQIERWGIPRNKDDDGGKQKNLDAGEGGYAGGGRAVGGVAAGSGGVGQSAQRYGVAQQERSKQEINTVGDTIWRFTEQKNKGMADSLLGKDQSHVDFSNLSTAEWHRQDTFGNRMAHEGLHTLMTNFAHDRLQQLLTSEYFLGPLLELKIDLQGEDELKKTDVVPYDNSRETLALFEGTLGAKSGIDEAKIPSLLTALEDLTFSFRAADVIEKHVRDNSLAAARGVAYSAKLDPTSVLKQSTYSYDIVKRNCEGYTKFKTKARPNFTIIHTANSEASYSCTDKVFAQGNAKLLPMPVLTYLLKAFDEDASKAVNRQRSRFVKHLFEATDAYQNCSGNFLVREALYSQQIKNAHAVLIKKLQSCERGVMTLCLVRPKKVLMDLERYQIPLLARQFSNAFSERYAYDTFIQKFQFLVQFTPLEDRIEEDFEDLLKGNPADDERMQIRQRKIESAKEMIRMILQTSGISMNDFRFSTYFSPKEAPLWVFLKHKAHRQLCRSFDQLQADLKPRINALLTCWRGIPARRFRTIQIRRAQELQAAIRAFRVRNGRKNASYARNMFCGQVLLFKLRVQDWWKEYCCIRLQSRWRARMARKKFLEILHLRRCLKAAVRIQTHVRRCFALRRVDRVRFQVLYMFSARVIQSKIKQFLAQRTLYCIALVTYYSASVFTIQRHWRGYVARQRYRNLVGLRMVIIRVKTLWREAEPYAVMIQAMVRGFQVRRRIPRIVQIVKEKRLQIAKHFFFHRNARKIQSVYRMHVVRNRYVRLLDSTWELQTFFRTLIWRRWFLALEKSADTLQKSWRNWWRLQTEKMAEESYRLRFVANLLEQDAQEGVVAPYGDRTIKLYPLMFGHMMFLGIQGKSSTRLGTLRGTLERITSNKNYVPKAIALGDSTSLILAEDRNQRITLPEPDDQAEEKGKAKKKVERYKTIVLQFGPGWVDWNPCRFIGVKIAIIAEMACGNAHCIVRTIDGRVFSWGNSEFYQCGHPSSAEPIPIEFDNARSNLCVSISAFRDTSGFVLEDRGIPVVCGMQEQLNVRNKKDQLTYLRSLPEMHKIYMCGEYHVLLSCYGDVYTWGVANLGQLGQGFNVRRSYEPTMILKAIGFNNNDMVFPPIKHLAVSQTHSLAITTENELALWGQAIVREEGEDSMLKPLQQGIAFPMRVAHRLWANDVGSDLIIQDKVIDDTPEQLLGVSCGMQGGLVYTTHYVVGFRQFRMTGGVAEENDRTFLYPSLEFFAGLSSSESVVGTFHTTSDNDWLMGIKIHEGQSEKMAKKFRKREQTDAMKKELERSGLTNLENTHKDLKRYENMMNEMSPTSGLVRDG